MSDFLNSLPDLSVMVLHSLLSYTTRKDLLNFKAYIVALNVTTL